MTTAALPAGKGRRSLAAVALLGLAALLVAAGFVSLGIWQLQRLHWKRDLIARVEARVHAPPVPAPGPARWRQIDAPHAEYLHVAARGRFLPGRDTRVQALTERGAGFWLMTPFVADRGFIVLVNRGFVPADRAAARLDAPSASVSLAGLLRITEPGGGFLRRNDPAAGRWYSRDVAAIFNAIGALPVRPERSRGAGKTEPVSSGPRPSTSLGTNGAEAAPALPIAPYFIDAAASAANARPVGGMTVIAFPNNHLQYALTWFALAALVAGGYTILVREELKARRGPAA